MAKWLRLAGIDVEYDKSIDDDLLVQRALKECHVMLTRDRSIAKRKDAYDCILIWNDHIYEQLLEFIQVFELRTLKNAFSECIRCNTLLEEVPKDCLSEKVPTYIWETKSEFRRCISCQRIYWAGTHRENAERFLRRVIGDF